MKTKYGLVIVTVLSIASLSVSLWVYWRSTLENGIPSGVKQVEIAKGDIENVTFDSQNYRLSLVWFLEYGERVELMVQTNGGSQIRNLILGKTTSFYDLRITFKETNANSIVVWVEKIEG